MASLGHIAVGLAAGRYYASATETEPTRHQLVRSMIAFSTLSFAPDADVWAFKLGIPYGDPFGHRGFTHSLMMAAALGFVIALVHRSQSKNSMPRCKLGFLVGVVMASHGILDTLTYGGGMGVALLWPFSDVRLWAPLRVIPVSPIGLGIFSMYGMKVIAAELVLFIPFWAYAFWKRRGKRI